MSMSPSGFVLVVEDSDEDFDTVMTATRQAELPYEIRRATSGEECLRLLAERGNERGADPVLVLMDLNTPRDDGRAALQVIRQHERLRTVPCVVLSTSANPRDLLFCYAQGANAYHTKPVDHPAHVQVIRQILDYWLKCVALPPAHF